ncbi:MAG: hypothetical protein J3R72DRAFT_512715 [Linnemannia gamsii]|nr:MAG: hypothetical protein J3R72DRAFT_512715 [Linnemannia gamsii]
MEPYILSTIAGRAATPMDIPEVAEMILSFLDDWTISVKVARVCRKWLNACLHRIKREATWDTVNPQENNKDNDLNWLRQASRINCYLREGVQLTDEWEALCEALRRRHEVYLEKLEQRRQGYLMVRNNKTDDDSDTTSRHLPAPPLLDLLLRELWIQGYADLSLSRLFPYVTSITNLNIIFACDGAIEMRLLLNNCPHLESISLESLCTLTLSGPWVLNEKTLKKRCPLPLQRLHFKGVQLPQSCLQALLTISPFIQQLTVCEAKPRAIGPYILDGPKLVEHVKQHNRHLQSFHFSNKENGSTILEIQLPNVVGNAHSCTTGIQRTFRGQEFTPSHVRNLQLQQPDMLTNIELLTQCPNLHDCLCLLPTLLHLKAPLAGFLLEYMDVHNRWQHGRLRLGEGRSLPKLWACRDLQTLHLGMYGYGNDPERARLLFGYVSVICPKLRDLEISGVDPWRPAWSTYRPTPLTMGLEGGLCLLSRLRFLERLRVGALDENIKLPSFHWDWMVDSSDRKTEEAKQRKRLKVIQSWKAKLAAEARRDKLRWQNMCLLEGVQDLTAHLGDDEQLKSELQHLGLLKDVALCLEGICDNQRLEGEGEDEDDDGVVAAVVVVVAVENPKKYNGQRQMARKAWCAAMVSDVIPTAASFRCVSPEASVCFQG